MQDVPLFHAALGESAAVAELCGGGPVIKVISPSGETTDAVVVCRTGEAGGRVSDGREPARTGEAVGVCRTDENHSRATTKDSSCSNSSGPTIHPGQRSAGSSNASPPDSSTSYSSEQPLFLRAGGVVASSACDSASSSEEQRFALSPVRARSSGEERGRRGSGVHDDVRSRRRPSSFADSCTTDAGSSHGGGMHTTVAAGRTRMHSTPAGAPHRSTVAAPQPTDPLGSCHSGATSGPPTGEGRCRDPQLNQKAPREPNPQPDWQDPHERPTGLAEGPQQVPRGSFTDGQNRHEPLPGQALRTSHADLLTSHADLRPSLADPSHPSRASYTDYLSLKRHSQQVEQSIKTRLEGGLLDLAHPALVEKLDQSNALNARNAGTIERLLNKLDGLAGENGVLKKENEALRRTNKTAEWRFNQTDHELEVVKRNLGKGLGREKKVVERLGGLCRGILACVAEGASGDHPGVVDNAGLAGIVEEILQMEGQLKPGGGDALSGSLGGSSEGSLANNSVATSLGGGGGAFPGNSPRSAHEFLTHLPLSRQADALLRSLSLEKGVLRRRLCATPSTLRNSIHTKRDVFPSPQDSSASWSTGDPGGEWSSSSSRGNNGNNGAAGGRGGHPGGGRGGPGNTEVDNDFKIRVLSEELLKRETEWAEREKVFEKNYGALLQYVGVLQDKLQELR